MSVNYYRPAWWDSIFLYAVVCRRRLSSVVVCNARGRSAAAELGASLVRRPTLQGGTVRLRPVRATPCLELAVVMEWKKYCHQRVCMSVCWCVCVSDCTSQKLHVQISRNFFVDVTCGRGSVHLWRRYILPVLRMTSSSSSSSSSSRSSKFLTRSKK